MAPVVPTMKHRTLQFEQFDARAMMAGDMVIQWNETALQAIRVGNVAPPIASRALAILHTAIFDAVNSIDRSRSAYLGSLAALRTTSKEAAVASAAHTVLLALFPAQQATLSQKFSQSLASVADGPSETAGVALGKQIGAMAVAARANDGASKSITYTAGSQPGDWQPTPPANASALLPQWPQVKPWAMKSAQQFSPRNPPTLSSARYTTAFQEVKVLGDINSATRTADQTNIAKFWANGAGTATPPGHLNILASVVSQQRGVSLTENARLFAMLNVALADAAIMAWDSKYATEFWRPITAIRAADSDGNAATTQDASWTPLLTTPPFPSYVSGHASFSGAAAAALKSFFGSDQVTFTLTSEVPSVPARTFTSFSQAAQESADSRIYGGIHWRFDNEDGLAAGRKIGELVAVKFFLSTPLQAQASLIGGVLIFVGTDRRDVMLIEQNQRGKLTLFGNGRKLGEFQAANLQRIDLDARGGNDHVDLGDDVRINAVIWGGIGNDLIFGGRGIDEIHGEEGNDILHGFRGNDRLFGEAGNDWLFGNAGDDLLSDNQGKNHFRSGLASRR